MKRTKLIEYRAMQNDFSHIPEVGEEVRVKGFTSVFAASNYHVGEWVITETKYGLLISRGKTKDEAIKNLKTTLKQFIANEVHKTPQDSFTAAMKWTIKDRVKRYMWSKYYPLLKAVYPSFSPTFYHPYFRFEITRFADKYYPEHATNNKSLKQMITEDKGQKIASIIKALL